jgi:urease accessory protein UreE
MKEDTFSIAKGDIRFDAIAVNNLGFALDEGLSDQDVLYWGDVVCGEVERLRKKLKKVML